ncbi:hypothetical protein ABH994_006581 [Bradyrhizobium yuanmingense]|uniref:hypothetical protein n=1 Tax=Bradyrhizobium yuanmingense TaxID=108015 RepID=UPI0035152806
MYQCTLHRNGHNTILAADNWKNLHRLIFRHAKQDSLWGMLYKDDRIWEHFFFPMTSLPDQAPGQFEISNRRRRLRSAS